MFSNQWRERPVRLAGLLMLLLLALLASGCLGDASTTSGEAGRYVAFQAATLELVTDVAGDARDHHGGSTEDLVDDVCDVPECERVEESLFGTAHALGGIEAPPALDVIGARAQAKTDGLDVTLELASLDEALSGTITADGNYGTLYTVNWHWRPGSACSLGTSLAVLELNGRLSLEPSVGYVAEHCPGASGDDQAMCPAFLGCRAAVPVEILPGSPGAIVWHVPWHALPEGTHATVFDDVVAATLRLGFAEGPSAGAYVGASSMDTYMTAYAVDWSEPADAGSLPRGAAMPPSSHGRLAWAPLFQDADAPVQNPRVHIEEATLVETPTSLELVLRLAEVNEIAEEILDASLHLPDGWRLHLGLEHEGGERQLAATLDGLDGDPARAVPATLVVEPGTPGTVAVRLLRADLPPLRAGDRLGLGYALAWDIDHRQFDAAGGSMETWVQVDGASATSGYAPAYRFAYDTALPEAASEALFDDEVGDVQAPDVPDPSFEPASFDIVSVGARATDEERSRVSIATAGPPASEVPALSQAVFYAVGVQTPNGGVMIGYYKDRDTPGGSFLCAQDTTVLTPTPRDPTAAAWTAIEGFVSAGGSGRDTGSVGADGSITLLVPNACFGAEPGEPIAVDRLVAATYLVRNPSGQAGAGEVVGPLDTRESDGPFTIAYAAAMPGFWSEPFGVDNFWDIAGIVLAVVTVLATAAVVLRRRRALRRYLAELARLEAAHADDPDGLASALVTLRHELHDALLRHRISENHYPIVAERLRSRITGARIESLGEAYYQLPGPLARRIERVLDDGRLTPSEHGTIAGLVGAAPLEPAKRRALVDRLARWLAEDGSSR